MKKFGFSRKSGKSSPAPSDNPYAQPAPVEDPYANDSSRTSMASSSYSQPSGLPSGPRQGLPSGPRGGGYGGGGPASRPPAEPRTNSYGNSGPGYGGGPGPRPAAAPQANSYGGSGSGYGGGPAPRPAAASQANSYGKPGSGYGSDKVGSGSGYGANRYQNEASFQQNQDVSIAPPPYSSREGGYGGLGGGDRNNVGGPGSERGNLGRKPSASTEAHRDDLFGGAKGRHDPERGNVYDPTNRPPPGARPGQGRAPGGYGATGESSGSYGGYGEERELTQEEQEQKLLRDTMAETSQVRDDTLQSTERTLQRMYEAQETARETLSRLGEQGERLHNAEKNMDLAETHNARGYNKTKELQTVNRSMFSVHVANPFTAKKRAQARDDEVMNRHLMEKEQRETTRRNQYAEARMVEGSMRGMSINDEPQPSYQRVPRDQNKFMFEDEDSEEERKEEAIDNNMNQMMMLAGSLKGLATDQGRVLEKQNEIIDRIGAKTDRVDYGVRRNRNELDKIR